MRPIELTVIDKRLVFVNPDNIAYFLAATDSFETYVWLTGVDDPIRVKETPEQIVGRLADHRSSTRVEEHDGIEIFR